jgi:hypothetical protein
MRNVNIVIEEHDDDFLAYPLGMNGHQTAWTVASGHRLVGG